jgi:hypothetical protein
MDENKIAPVKYVDLDGTLAYFDQWLGPEVIGAPITRMVKKVKAWLDQGVKVVVFTARLCVDKNLASIAVKDRDAIVKAVKAWCLSHIGQELEVTSDKGFFHKVYDDRAVSIVMNTGLSREEILLEMIADLHFFHQNDDSYILETLTNTLRNLVKSQ